MIYRIVALASLFGVAACGNSAAQLARNADPKVCAAAGTTETLFAIMKQQAGFTSGEIQDTGVTGKELLADMTLIASDITSKSIDKDTQSVDCNATVRVRGLGLSEYVEQSVDYNVKPNLSDDEDIIVSMMQSDGISAVTQVAGMLLTVKEKKL